MLPGGKRSKARQIAALRLSLPSEFTVVLACRANSLKSAKVEAVRSSCVCARSMTTLRSVKVKAAMVIHTTISAPSTGRYTSRSTLTVFRFLIFLTPKRLGQKKRQQKKKKAELAHIKHSC